MSVEITPEADLGEIRRQWARLSLERGRSLSELVLPCLDFGRGTCVVPGAKEPLPATEIRRLEGGVLHVDALDGTDNVMCMCTLLRKLASVRGYALLLVEADLLGPNDPATTQPQIPAGSMPIARGTVFASCCVGVLESENDLVRLLGRGSGYPLNAFLLSGEETADAYMLRIERDEAQVLARALLATVHSIYDSDAYAAWMSWAALAPMP